LPRRQTPPPPKKIDRRAAAAGQNHPTRRRRKNDVGAGLYIMAFVMFRAFNGQPLGLFPEISSGSFFTKNTVQTFEITVYLFTSSLSLGFYSTPVH